MDIKEKYSELLVTLLGGAVTVCAALQDAGVFSPGSLPYVITAVTCTTLGYVAQRYGVKVLKLKAHDLSLRTQLPTHREPPVNQ